MKVHVKTHNDLDAVGSVIVLRCAGKIAGITVSSVSYHTYTGIDDAIKNHLKSKHVGKDDLLLITDICPSNDILDLLDAAHQKGVNIRLLDHHKTKVAANKYDWATVDIDKCATELVFDAYYRKMHPPSDFFGIHEFVDAVCAWDLWKLESKHRNRSVKLNTLLGFLGKNDFINEFMENIDADKLSPFREVLKHLEKRKNRYVNQVIKKQLEAARCYKDGYNNRFKVIFATDYISEIGNAILDHQDAIDLEYVCVINPTWNTCSLRARKGGVDVGSIAKFFGGGGHPGAAGFPCEFTESIEAKVWQLLNRINY